MKSYRSWDWILEALPELSAITGLLRGRRCQAFRTHMPPTPWGCRCRMLYMCMYMAGRSYPLSQFISGLSALISTISLIFLHHVLDSLASTFTSSSLWSGVFSYLCVLPLLLLVPSGFCVPPPHATECSSCLSYVVTTPEEGQRWPKAQEDPVSDTVKLHVI